MAESTLLSRLDGIDARFEEVSLLITDPSVISDMKRFVKLTKEYKDLEKLTKPVELIATLDDSAKSAEIKELLAEIAELSDKVTFKEDNTLAVRKPSFLITNPGSDQGPRFAGSPLGHEFTSLVLALLWTGGHPSKEAQSLLDPRY
jgi:alkyl hydroperoxide reductase subunit AhpF